MKRKNLWLLAPPLIGLVLVWHEGQRRRDEAEAPAKIYEVVLRHVVASELPGASQVFVSIDGHDPSAALLGCFGDHKPEFLPASRQTPHNSGGIEEGRRRLHLNLSNIHWKKPLAVVYLDGVPGMGHAAYHLKPQGGQWKVVWHSLSGKVYAPHP